MSGIRARAARWRVVEWFAAAIAVVVGVAVVGLVVGLVALARLGDARERTVDVLDPAIATALGLNTALLDEETGVRGFALSGGDLPFLAPYIRGRAAEPALLARLRRDARRSGGDLGDHVAAVAAAADTWRTRFGSRIIANTRAGRRQFTVTDLEPAKAS